MDEVLGAEQAFPCRVGEQEMLPLLNPHSHAELLLASMLFVLISK